MKVSEKYFAKYFDKIINVEGCVITNPEQLNLYGQICALEAQQTLLVSNPSTFPQEKYTDKLAEIVNAIQEISEREKL